MSSLLLVSLCCSLMQYYYCHAHEEQHHERKQTHNLTIKHKSHTIIILFYLFTISSLPFSSWWSGIIRHYYLFHALCSQYAMFRDASSFNQDVSSWDVSSGTVFVSCLGPWHSAACWCRLRRRVCRLLEHCCRCCSWYHGCWQHGCFVANTCNTMIVMLMRRNSIMSGNK